MYGNARAPSEMLSEMNILTIEHDCFVWKHTKAIADWGLRIADWGLGISCFWCDEWDEQIQATKSIWNLKFEIRYKAKNQKPKAKNQEPKTKNQKPKTKDQKPKTNSNV